MRVCRAALFALFALVIAVPAWAAPLVGTPAWQVTLSMNFTPGEPCREFLTPGDPCRPFTLGGTAALWEQFSLDTLPVLLGAAQVIPTIGQSEAINFSWIAAPTDPCTPTDPCQPIRLLFSFTGSVQENQGPSFAAFTYSAASLSLDLPPVQPALAPLFALDSNGFLGGGVIAFDAPIRVGDFTVNATAVPEPASLLLLGTGMAFLRRSFRRR